MTGIREAAAGATHQNLKTSGMYPRIKSDDSVEVYKSEPIHLKSAVKCVGPCSIWGHLIEEPHELLECK